MTKSVKGMIVCMQALHFIGPVSGHEIFVVIYVAIVCKNVQARAFQVMQANKHVQYFRVHKLCHTINPKAGKLLSCEKFLGLCIKSEIYFWTNQGTDFGFALTQLHLILCTTSDFYHLHLTPERQEMKWPQQIKSGKEAAIVKKHVRLIFRRCVPPRVCQEIFPPIWSNLEWGQLCVNIRDFKILTFSGKCVAIRYTMFPLAPFQIFATWKVRVREVIECTGGPSMSDIGFPSWVLPLLVRGGKDHLHNAKLHALHVFFHHLYPQRHCNIPLYFVQSHCVPIFQIKTPQNWYECYGEIHFTKWNTWDSNKEFYEIGSWTFKSPEEMRGR